MTHPERANEYLGHILQAIDRATRYLSTLPDAVSLRQNDQVQDAVVRYIEVIGEATVKLQREAPTFLTTHPHIPWADMRRMRNRMIHQYFDIDWDVVWRTVKNGLPSLKRQIEALIQQHDRRLP